MPHGGRVRCAAWKFSILLKQDFPQQKSSSHALSRASGVSIPQRSSIFFHNSMLLRGDDVSAVKMKYGRSSVRNCRKFAVAKLARPEFRNSAVF
ncbi:MAG: hypothetical protein DME40_03335 [Verrucomicrobia bacterium]|nr:MAG: hypothetical protein DME40_03335 [Verrucomicrobiota bacterium]